jgi:hypothetical protein
LFDCIYNSNHDAINHQRAAMNPVIVHTMMCIMSGTTHNTAGHDLDNDFDHVLNHAKTWEQCAANN